MTRIDTLPHFLEDVADSIRNKLDIDYQQVEYIESTGSQFIDVGVVPKSTSRMVLEVAMTNLASNNRNGWHSSGNLESFSCGSYTSHSTYYMTCSSSSSYVMSDIPFDYKKHVFDISNKALICDGTSYGTGNIGDTATTGQTIYIFALHDEGETSNPYGAQFGWEKIYSCQVYDGDILIRYLIPCYRKYDGKTGMYDTVNDKFYENGGTGEFKKGPDTKSLPSEYQAVDGIGSTGTQFIDTGVKLLTNFEINIQWKTQTSGVRQAIMSSYDPQVTHSNKNYWCFELRADNTFRWVTYNQDEYESGTSTIDEIYDSKITCNNGSAVIYRNNVQQTTLQSLVNAASNLLLFDDYRHDSTFGNEIIWIYSCSIVNNGVIVRNFVPCYRKSDNVIGMYDLINDIFYTNLGTGTFSKGNDIKELPFEYQRVEYIESSRTQYINTNYKLNSNTTKIEIEYQFTNITNNYNCLFGYETASSNRFMVRHNMNATNDLTFFTPSVTGITVSSSTKNKIVFELTNNNVIINGTSTTLTINVDTSGDNLFLFGLNYRGNFASDNASSIKIYSFKIYENSVLSRSYVPCYRKTDNEIGMYDLVNDVFYTNSGTGAFTKGSNIETIPGNIVSKIPAYEFDEYIQLIPNVSVDDFFNGNFADSTYTKDAAGLKSFFDNEYFKPKYYPLPVDVNQVIGSGAYSGDTSEFYIPSLINMTSNCNSAFKSCSNIIIPPDFSITISGTQSRPSEMFSGVYASNLTGQNVKCTLNASTYWPDNMFGNAYRIGEGSSAEEKHLDITFNYTDTQAHGTFGNMFFGLAKNNPNLADVNQQSNYIVTINFRGLSNWTAISGTSWNDSVWDYYSRIFGSCYGKILNVNGLKFVAETYRAHRMFEGCFCSQINLIDCVFTGSYNFKRWFYNCPNLTTVDLSTISNSHPTFVDEMFLGCTSLTHIDLRNFTLTASTNYTDMFGADATTGVPDDCEIIVADNTQKDWVQTKFSRLTNVKTVAEYEGGN